MALKFYVSLPMAYHQKSVRKRYDKAVEEIRKKYPDALIMALQILMISMRMV